MEERRSVFYVRREGRILCIASVFASWDEKNPNVGEFATRLAENAEKNFEACFEKNCAFKGVLGFPSLGVIPYHFSLKISVKDFFEPLYRFCIDASLICRVQPSESKHFHEEYIFDPERMIFLTYDRFFIPKTRLHGRCKAMSASEGSVLFESEKGNVRITARELSDKYSHIFSESIKLTKKPLTNRAEYDKI